MSEMNDPDFKLDEVTPEHRAQASEKNTEKMRKYVTKFAEKSGTFLHPQTGKKTKFAGAVLQMAESLQTSNVGFGWFPGWNQTGAVVLEESVAP